MREFFPAPQAERLHLRTRSAGSERHLLQIAKPVRIQAKEIVGDEPFAVLLPDDIVDAKTPCMKQMVEAFNETQSTILASEAIEGPSISAYGVLDWDKPRREPPKPKLSKAALEGAAPLRTFSELAAFLEAKEKDEPAPEAAAAPVEAASAPVAPPS